MNPYEQSLQNLTNIVEVITKIEKHDKALIYDHHPMLGDLKDRESILKKYLAKIEELYLLPLLK